MARWHSDIRVLPFPRLDWENPGGALDLLYGWADETAAEAESWYMRDKRWRAWSCQILRALTVVLGAAGATLPLIGAARHEETANWGYVLLALGASCIGADRIFGLSTGWMRCTIAANAIRRRQSIFRVEWSSRYAGARVSHGAAFTGEAITELTTLVHAFVSDLHDLVGSETLEWRSELQMIVQQMQERVDREGGEGPAGRQGSGHPTGRQTRDGLAG